MRIVLSGRLSRLARVAAGAAVATITACSSGSPPASSCHAYLSASADARAAITLKVATFLATRCDDGPKMASPTASDLASAQREAINACHDYWNTSVLDAMRQYVGCGTTKK